MYSIYAYIQTQYTYICRDVYYICRCSYYAVWAKVQVIQIVVFFALSALSFCPSLS